MLARVEVDQVPGMRPDNRAVLVDSSYVSRRLVMRDHQLTACRVIGAEQQAGQRVSVDMALKPHFGALLDVEDDAVAVVARGQDMLLGGLGCESEEFAAIRRIEPGQAVSHLVQP